MYIRCFTLPDRPIDLLRIWKPRLPARLGALARQTPAKLRCRLCSPSVGTLYVTRWATSGAPSWTTMETCGQLPARDLYRNEENTP